MEEASGTANRNDMSDDYMTAGRSESQRTKNWGNRKLATDKLIMIAIDYETGDPGYMAPARSPRSPGSTATPARILQSGEYFPLTATRGQTPATTKRMKYQETQKLLPSRKHRLPGTVV